MFDEAEGEVAAATPKRPGDKDMGRDRRQKLDNGFGAGEDGARTSTSAVTKPLTEPEPAPLTTATEIPLPERLPWNEIQARYPDQWVVMIDATWARGQPLAGRVLCAARKVKDTLDKSKALREDHPRIALAFTGEVRLRKPLFEVLYG